MPTTVAELITRVREYADARDDGDDPYISDTAILAWLNQENRRLVRRVARLGYAWGLTAVSFTSTIDLDPTNAPAGVLAIAGVYEIDGTRYRPLPRLVDGYPYDSSRRHWTVTKGQSGTNGYLTIAVGEVGTYEVRYIQAPFRLALTAGALQDDTVYLPVGWEEVLVLGAAIRAKAKEGSDTESPLLRQLYQDEWEDIEVEAANNDANTLVRNVDSSSPPGYPTNFSYGDGWYWL